MPPKRKRARLTLSAQRRKRRIQALFPSVFARPRVEDEEGVESQETPSPEEAAPADPSQSNSLAIAFNHRPDRQFPLRTFFSQLAMEAVGTGREDDLDAARKRPRPEMDVEDEEDAEYGEEPRRYSYRKRSRVSK